jgi:hypothetical protein
MKSSVALRFESAALSDKLGNYVESELNGLPDLRRAIKSEEENLEAQVTLIVLRMAFRLLNTTALVITALGTVTLVVLAIIYG